MSVLATPDEIVAFFKDAHDLLTDPFGDVKISDINSIQHRTGRQFWNNGITLVYFSGVGFVGMLPNNSVVVAKPSIQGDTFLVKIFQEDKNGEEKQLPSVSFVRNNAKTILAMAIDKYLSKPATVSPAAAVLAKALKEQLAE